VHLGSTRIDKIYKSYNNGTSELVYWRQGLAKPYLDFEFYDGTTFDPNNITWLGEGADEEFWTYIGQGSKGDIWRFTRLPYSTTNTGDHDLGWPWLFCSGTDANSSDLTHYKLGCYCDIVACGNLSINEMRNFDSAFRKANAIKNICVLPFVNATNVNGMFYGCTNMDSGQLAEYTYLSSLSDVPVHSSTFVDCGSSSTSGSAELDQIPVGWGGNLAPVSTSIQMTRYTQKTSWYLASFYPNPNPFLTSGFAINMYTTSSVSQYAGVNMKKSNVKWNTRNGSAPSTNKMLYYYPCFFQGSMSSSGAPDIDWFALSEQPNGSLSGSSGDMPGTLDYNLFGHISAITWSDYAYAEVHDDLGTFNFGFFVTDLSPTEIWTDHEDPLDRAYGLLYNNYFNTSVTLNYIVN
jgi:hypothetical protein